jgi:hypothetical protein
MTPADSARRTRSSYETRRARSRPPGWAPSAALSAAIVLGAACSASQTRVESLSSDERARGTAAFTSVQQVLQHPRCQNCHIPGDAPLQFDDGQPHAQGVLRGPDGKGAPGLPCSTCHGEKNPPASYGPHAPPGAPNWSLPPPEHKMVTLGLSSAELCEALKDPERNGHKDFDALVHHVSEDALVLWGWDPGGQRAPVPVPHAEFVEQFEIWASLGGPCPSDDASLSAR